MFKESYYSPVITSEAKNGSPPSSRISVEIVILNLWRYPYNKTMKGWRSKRKHLWLFVKAVTKIRHNKTVYEINIIYRLSIPPNNRCRKRGNGWSPYGNIFNNIFLFWICMDSIILRYPFGQQSQGFSRRGFSRIYAFAQLPLVLGTEFGKAQYCNSANYLFLTRHATSFFIFTAGLWSNLLLSEK